MKINDGLSDQEAKERLAIQGYNELPSAKPKSIWRIILEVFKEPMFILLISCGLLYILLGDYKEGVLMLSTILIIIFITFYQYQKTEKALEALRKLSSPRALVKRGGVELRIQGREIVTDDILLLNEGDRIAADAVILDSSNLNIDESMLTGESLPVLKTDFTEINDSKGQVFSGTLVVQGKGAAKVVATGVNTQFGKIGKSLQSIGNEGGTRLQNEMKILIRNLFLIGAIMSIAVVSAFYFTRGNFIQSLLNGLAAAMAILPEEFPVVLTIFLALGAWRLSKRNVLTRNPSAIESLGSATVLCSDKTGTITQNRMEIAALYAGQSIVLKKDFKDNRHALIEILTNAQYASQIKSLDPMEKAIDMVCSELLLNSIHSFEVIKEYPLSKEMFAMTRVLKNTTENINVGATKGAPEVIFKLCKMSTDETSKQLDKVNEMAAQGFRVIAVAKSDNPRNSLPENQDGFELSFLGLIGFEDPIRAEVPQAVKECHDAGIKVIMITGDYPLTAKSIASQIGLPKDGQLITGSELALLNDEALRKKIGSTSIFARVLPQHKLRIVNALKDNNEIVAMTGDGVNDAPALKAAHIGIAMGNKGTDVAREASSLVLLDDNFASIVSAIRSGRKIFDNLQKAMSYILAIHIPIIGLTLLPAFISSLPLLLLPLHIVFMELIIDPVSSIAFESEQEESNIMKRQPRNPDELFFGRKKIMASALRGLLLLIMVLVVYFSSIREGHSDGEVRAITFAALIIGNLFLVLTSLSKTRSFISAFKEKNRALIAILSGAIIMLFLILCLPVLQHLFSFEFPGFTHFLTSLTGAFILMLILESFKFFGNQR